MDGTETYPRIFCIDGVDGCGKATISKMVKERLEREGYRIATISPPFYQTNTGKAVMDYLTNGYGDIRDRVVASMLYSNDRNMFYREHFDEIFASGKYDIVMYDRNWLSNVFYQTTMICQSPEDTARFFTKRYPYISYHGMRYALSLPALHDAMYDAAHENYPSLLSDETYSALKENRNEVAMLTADDRVSLWNTYLDERCGLVCDMIDMVNRMEVEPWTVKDPVTGKPIVFTDACPIKTVVLSPQMKAEHVDFIHSNLMQRYENDSSKLDRNEQSKQYLLAVVENIHWINSHRWAIIHADGQSRCGTTSVNSIKRRFAYEIVHTTIDTKEGTAEQRELEAIADQVYFIMTK